MGYDDSLKCVVGHSLAILAVFPNNETASQAASVAQLVVRRSTELRVVGLIPGPEH